MLGCCLPHHSMSCDLCLPEHQKAATSPLVLVPAVIAIESPPCETPLPSANTFGGSSLWTNKQMLD